LVAGRTGQEYNVRKDRKGAFWEDRYHATAVESGDHLLRCIIYIDLNMVRAGVATHPSDWEFCGYNEIQNPRRKCALIAYERLRALLDFSTYEGFVAAHRKWIDQSLRDNLNRKRDSKWTESIAVGSKDFTENTKRQLGIIAKGRKVIDSQGICELRESESAYLVNFASENSDIDINNAYFWNAIADISR